MRTVDARGLVCPLPILALAKAVRTLAPGDEVMLLATDPGVEADVAAWCQSTGHMLLSLGRQDNGYVARIQKVQ